ncbi:adenylate/guanylate cyclase domain-containing protein [Muricauda sp. MAR_2010_75]|uniref:adenylate/guanylate cyclase domain-containing protein n=1 Tax=Allomuricauda sp. MAR_2010_75 TaxID=1250232 RepID=UPI0018CDAA8E|nr:adenylate/guanylate cyclase domain-containing protein [Muricauda sp. MAR_2010_75]
MGIHRKLTAIMFTDVQGYTAIMHEDEQRALTLRSRHRKLFNELTEKHRGTVVQYFGDGTLTVFDSAVDAVECALELQKAFRQAPVIPVRIGIHMGDIVLSDDDIMGDAVNVASRIESVGVPGSVFFSDHVNDQLRSHKKFETRFLDVFHFKNVKEPIPVYALVDDQLVAPDRKAYVKTKSHSSFKGAGNRGTSKQKILRWGGVLVLLAILAGLYFTFVENEKSPEGDGELLRSIAVLPVQNLTGISENDVLCETITDDLIGQLSDEVGMVKVVPKSLIQDYLDQGEPLQKMAAALNVGYILEGALHHSDSLYNLDLRLADAMERMYLWSERYDHVSGANVATMLQSQASGAISAELNAHMNSANTTISPSPTDNKDASELLARANAIADKMDKESLYQAMSLYQRVIQLEPNLSDGYMGMARVYTIGGLIWGIFRQEEAEKLSKEYVEKSMALKPTLEAYQYVLITKFFFDFDFEYSEEHLSLVAILPPFPDGAFYAVYNNIVGRYDEGIRYAENYIERFPEAGNGFAQMIRAYFLSDRWDKADSLMNRYDAKFRHDQFYMRDVAMVHLNMGNMESFMEMNNILKTNFLDNAAVHLYYDAIEMRYKGEDPKKIQEKLNLLEDQYNMGMAGSPAWFLAMYHFYIKDDETGFQWLQKSFDRKDVEILWLKNEYLLQRFKKAQDPRYTKLYNQMHWPE